MTRRLILAIESATYDASCAVLDGARVLAERTVRSRGRDGEHLLPAVDDALREAGAAPADIERVVCGGGPGSFTSLRVGASIAKGICASLGVPLATVPSLALIVAGQDPPRGAGRYLAVLDAMRGERFVQPMVVDSEGGAPRLDGEITLIPEDGLERLAKDAGATTIGPGAAVQAIPHARGVAVLLGTAMIREVDLASWEPDYGRLAEAQARWEATHGRPLDSATR